MFFRGGRSLISALVILVGATIGSVCAEETRTVINAATTPAAPPTEYVDQKSNKLAGFDIELLEAIAAKMGVNVNWIQTSWEQLYPSLKTKRADVIVDALADMPERRASVSYVDYANDYVTMVTLHDNAARFPSLETVCGARVGNRRSSQWNVAVAEWNAEHCVKAGRPAIVLVGTDSSADSRLQLKQGRIDVAVQEAFLIGYQNSIENNLYVRIGKPFYSQLMGIGFSKDDPDLGNAIKVALEKLIADGTYQNLLAKWGMADAAIRKVTINGQP
ncbi:transporter substrate-binding domain-containing protein [Paraburkholderia phenoliruptrix]|uniref:transporter substrate-binding domain-containing protein n=1 Tax=Paraburkholderia phenoliruptrix TaxID=252970 RepID=UPI002869E37D|nr:transporter substrate-binding domain-containing protein [Paraburkholderia phenoliruptrix]WMY11045.1 transporter substrate-binding domain-containing protein [Paraburkholderia phenoliruptrix]